MAGTVVSHHMLRRTARRKARWLNDHEEDSTIRYVVRKYGRGPWRWKVLQISAR